MPENEFLKFYNVSGDWVSLIVFFYEITAEKAENSIKCFKQNSCFGLFFGKKTSNWHRMMFYVFWCMKKKHGMVLLLSLLLLLLLLFCIKLLHHKDLKFPETIVFIYLFILVGLFFQAKTAFTIRVTFKILNYWLWNNIFCWKRPLFCNALAQKTKTYFLWNLDPRTEGDCNKGRWGCGVWQKGVVVVE